MLTDGNNLEIILNKSKSKFTHKLSMTKCQFNFRGTITKIKFLSTKFFITSNEY